MPLPLLPVDNLWQQMEARGVHIGNMIFDYEYGNERSVALSRQERPLPTHSAHCPARGKWRGRDLTEPGEEPAHLSQGGLHVGQVKQKSCLGSRASKADTRY